MQCLTTRQLFMRFIKPTDQSGNFIVGSWLGNQKTLDGITAHLTQHMEDMVIFHAFGNHAMAEVMTEVNNRMYNLGVVIVFAHIENK